jgi:hypothetical protein
MTSRAMVYLGLTVALAACSKNSQQTDAMSPPPRDTTHATQPSSKKPASDTTQVRMERPDTSQYGKDSTKAKTDTTGQR